MKGGKTALRGGTLDSRPQFRNRGSRVSAGARRLVGFLVLRYLAHLQPETTVGRVRGGGKTGGKETCPERGVALELRG